jgi:hypothetical protein
MRLRWLVLATVVGCARPAPPAQSATRSVASAAPDAATTPSYDDCASDGDCVGAPALAGLAAVPADPASAECGAVCFVAVARARLAAWQALRQRLEPAVPCDKKFGKCGPPPDAVLCRAGHCRL